MADWMQGVIELTDRGIPGLDRKPGDLVIRYCIEVLDESTDTVAMDLYTGSIFPEMIWPLFLGGGTLSKEKEGGPCLAHEGGEGDPPTFFGEGVGYPPLTFWTGYLPPPDYS